MSSGLYPTLLAIECDYGDCEVGFAADFLVSDSDTALARYEPIYSHVELHNWKVLREENLTYCPAHAEKEEC